MAAILVVEDDVFIREVLEMTVEDLGHQVFSAGDVDEALSLLRSPHHFHALITDIHLKAAVHGGFEVAHQAIKLWPKLRVLYTTGYVLTDEMKTLFVEGAQCLRKPYSERNLRDSVERLVAP